jgi:hypothetical protein
MAAAVNTLLRDLRAAMSGEAEPVPAGWKTRVQWAKEWEISDVRAGVLLSKGVEIGRMEIRKFRIANAGTVRPVPHYREKPQKPHARRGKH